MAAKRQRKAPPGTPKYHRLTAEERITIQALRKEGCSIRHIANRIGCAPSSVSRELRRNAGRKGCRAKKAKAEFRVRAKAQSRHKLAPEMRGYIKDRMSGGWTPGQIGGRGRHDGVPTVSRETIY